ncbi:MAG: DMT family transporter [Gammaproteobacteria bacterium]
MSATHSFKNDFLLVGVTLLAAAGWMFSKNALQGMPPLYFLGIRFTLAGLILAALAVPQLRQLSALQWRQAARLGCLFAVALMIWIIGLHHTVHVGEGAFITSMGVVIVPVFARFIFKDTLPLSTWVAIPVALAGLGLLSLNRGVRLEAGQILFLVSATLFALHFNLITRVVASIPALALTSIQLTVVGIVSWSVALLVEDYPATVGIDIWGWLLAAVLLASSGRFLLQTYAQSRTSASHAAIIMVLEPVWASLMAGLWLDESMTMLQLAGCSLIFMALLVNRWRVIRNLIRSRW